MSSLSTSNNGSRAANRSSKTSTSTSERLNKSYFQVGATDEDYELEREQREEQDQGESAGLDPEGSCGGTIVGSVTTEAIARLGSIMHSAIMQQDNHLSAQSEGKTTDGVVVSSTASSSSSHSRSVPEDLFLANRCTGLRQPTFSFVESPFCTNGYASSEPSAQPLVRSTMNKLSDMSTIASEYNEAAPCEEDNFALSYTPSMVQREFGGVALDSEHQRGSDFASDAPSESLETQLEEKLSDESEPNVPRLVLNRGEIEARTCNSCATGMPLRSEMVVQKRRYRVLSRICLSVAIGAVVVAVFFLVHSEMSKKQAATEALFRGKLEDQNKIIKELTKTIERLQSENNLLRKDAESLKQYKQRNTDLEGELRRLKKETSKAILKSHANSNKLKEESKAQCIKQERDLLEKVLENKQQMSHSKYMYWDIALKLLGAFAQPAACYFFDACPTSNRK